MTTPFKVGDRVIWKNSNAGCVYVVEKVDALAMWVAWVGGPPQRYRWTDTDVVRLATDAEIAASIARHGPLIEKSPTRTCSPPTPPRPRYDIDDDALVNDARDKRAARGDAWMHGGVVPAKQPGYDDPTGDDIAADWEGSL